MIRAIFNKTGECAFERIYNRPLGKALALSLRPFSLAFNPLDPSPRRLPHSHTPVSHFEIVPPPFLGYRCLKDCFGDKVFKEQMPGPHACIAFLDCVKDLYADKAKDALAIAKGVSETHLQSEVR